MSTYTRDERELLSKPGDAILETLQHIKMSQVELAERMGKTTSKINDIIFAKEPITMATALLLEKVLGIDAQFWINRESLYREKISRIEQMEMYETSVEWLKMQPYKQLQKSGYIQSKDIGPEMVSECLQFYGVASPKQWQSMYIDQYVSVEFRKSSAHQTPLNSIAAWLRIGEVEKQKINLPEYKKDLFKESLIEVLAIVKKHPEDFASRLHRISLKSGVALIFTPCLPKAPVSGATRWIGGNPLIQLTDRYKTNDQFWFTFFHEAAHILLHGKKEVFIEDFEGFSGDKSKEEEANNFASEFLLPAKFLNDLPIENITENDVRNLARTYDTHPAIVVGRLRYLKKVNYSFGTNLLIKINLDEQILNR